MDISIEMIPPHRIAYARRTGPYGPENVQIMEQLKSWAREKNLLNESSVILGITQDNPQFTQPEKCRYDAGIIVPEAFKADDEHINFGKTTGGKYCVFKISHTADAMQKAWLEIFSELSKREYEFDDRRPVIERYTMQMVNRHYCEICVPIL
ncbi:MAG: GyrI-like domain-containing protein [Lacrimispora sp.]|uniref:AraC family transcriptional regulator n=1 Tax=Lacrimispora sp. TaxID=2719234 RepID=UPI0039E458E2